MRLGRIIRGAAVIAAALSLAACASLPMTGDVRPGLAVGQSDSGSDIAFVARGPSDGMDPEQIVRGFIDAASSPADSWSIARQFLTPAAAQTWKPDSGVTIDTALTDRRYDVPDVQKQATTATVRLSLQQTASVDENGAYASKAVNGTADLGFSLAKNADGQWRISAAPDGVVLDAQSFADAGVFAPYSLEYFDPTWTYLVPDVRWFPKRKNTASRIVQSLVGGKPSAWLTNGVRTAFTGDIALAHDAIAVDSQVAEVSLTDAALSADSATMSRMRTQLERSLIGVGVLQVKLMAGGRDLNAGTASVASTVVDSRPLVLTDKGFGYLSGGGIAPIPGVSTEVAAFSKPITAISAASGAQRVVAQASDGIVYAIADGKVDQIDGRAGLAPPTLDPFGYVWTVPQGAPASALIAWSTTVSPRPIAAQPDGSQVSGIAISRDGSRLALAVTASGLVRVEVAAVSRDDRGAPTGIGPLREVAWPAGPVMDLTWLDDTTLGVLTSDAGRTVLLEQSVGGPQKSADAPDVARVVAPSSPASNIQLLGSSGVMWVRSVTTWQLQSSNVKVLATQLGG
ncbi:LpqB family beta-propeller domain-containing protein [Microbacterium sp. ASV81]|uniref:LpqB family beta-propeller domain-containing protein n=1 Tax=Microbacterium capsulatum TaxID=3041921 RepID=A0ABU0XJW2_9MICO|nr:LpqB family beta-propeller domain-containing protein [Microbacterium sp. ASV81]MDQ4215416.1 LpqB family beta-propeller domain-containing protein [Microbacterium sp. ASV81]